MRYGFRIGFAFVLGLALMAGCSDGNAEGGSGGAGGASTVEKIFVVRGWSPEFAITLGVIEGVKICATDTDDCVWTNDEGRAVLEIPIDREFSLTLEKDGWAPHVMPDFQPEELYLFPTAALSLEERNAEIHEQVMSPYPMQGTGSIVIVAEPSFSSVATGCVGVAGVTFELSNATGKGFYYDEEANWDASLTETSCWGWGGFTEVPPGEVQVEIGGNAKDCSVLHGWPGTVENSVRMPVRIGHNTRVQIECKEISE